MRTLPAFGKGFVLSGLMVPYKASLVLFLPAFSLSYDSPHDFGDSTENYQLQKGLTRCGYGVLNFSALTTVTGMSGASS